MPELQTSNPRKHLHSKLRPSQTSSQPVLKEQKLKHSQGSQPPTAFWDNLSKIWLTKRALKELDQRNTRPAPSSHGFLYQQSHQLITRNAVTEWKNKEESWKPTQSAAECLAHYSAKRLKDIKLLARHGGPDLSDLRGYPEPINPLCRTMSSRNSNSRGRKRHTTTSSTTKPTTNTTSKRKGRPYDRNFQQNLIDGGIYPDGYRYPDGRVPAKPNNWEEIHRRLAQPRASLSLSKFSDEEFSNFRQADVDAFKEDQITKSVIPIIEGKILDGKCVSGNIPFTNLNPLTDSTLVSGNPDLYYGARPEQLSRQVREKLSDYIIPSTQHDLPIAPNFFLSAKGPDGSLAVAGRQASYNGALGARGIHSLQSYGQDESAYDNNAYTITSIYHGGMLKMYTSHPSQPSDPGNRPEYYMTQINTWGMTGNTEAFRQGATAFRNLRDWTKEQRDEAIKRANQLANPSRGQVSATAHQDPDTSTDELAKGANPPAKRSRSSQSSHRKRNKSAAST